MKKEEKTYLSKKKYKELEEELDFLKNKKRQEIASDLEYAKSLGDLSENAEYNEARENQAMVEARIRKLESLLQNAEVVSKRKKGDEIQVGSTVIVRKKGRKTKQEFEIVGAEESDTSKGKISHLSPLGKALIGKKKGQKAKFELPSGDKIVYNIVKVS